MENIKKIKDKKETAKGSNSKTRDQLKKRGQDETTYCPELGMN